MTEDLQAKLEWYEQFGTAQEAERVRAEMEGRDPVDTSAYGTTQSGAMVPPDQVHPAALPPRDLGPTGQTEFPNPDDDTPVRESDPEVEKYEKWTKDDLVAEAEVRNRSGANIDATQNKEPLIAALRADDEAQQPAEA